MVTKASDADRERCMRDLRAAYLERLEDTV